MALAKTIASRTYGSRLAEYARFGFTGALNTGTDFVVLNSLLSITGGSHGAYLACKAVSFAIAVVQSYFLNKYWVFQAKGEGKNMEETARFFAVSVAGLVFNIVGSSIVFGLLGALNVFDFRVRANIGALVGTLLVLAWNYTGYKFFVFKKLATLK
ncbi:MAG TPA: GtrA family protein [Candidatus Paceibacterota bacterium]|nr:GtrA family protein [Candidatus Paceibacterota bacterium]